MRNPFKRRIGVATVCGIAIFVLSFGACGDDEAKPSPSESATVAATATKRPASPSPTEEPFSGGREPVQVTATPSTDQARLKDVRAARHTTFDRFTLEFDIAPPGYKVEYAQPPIFADPSGQEVTIDGTAFLQITIQGAVANYLQTGGTTYTGPNELKPGLPSLVDAKLTGDFEAVLTWVLGLSEETDFRVTAVDGPARLVIDVGHP
jgi:hypothetical protein